MELLHEVGADAGTTRLDENCNAPDLAARVEIDAPRPDGTARGVVRKDMDAVAIALVELDVDGDTLLVDENDETHTADGGEVRLVTSERDLQRASAA